MKVLKGFGVGLLSFLLFVSLSVFGMAFMLNSTLLNPDFIVAEVDKIDIPALAGELIQNQISAQLPGLSAYLNKTVSKVIADQEPWLKKQLNAAIYSGYDYLLGKSERLNIKIPLEPLKENLRNSLWQAFKENLAPPLAVLPQDQLKIYFDQFYQESASQIPSELVVDESLIPQEAMKQIVLARQYIGYFQTGYKALIGFMVLLVLGIILINRSVRGTTRSLGIDFLIYGALEFAGVYVARNYAPISLPLQGVPPSLQTWVPGLFTDFLVPLQVFSIGVLIAGVVLLVVSFIYKPGTTED